MKSLQICFAGLVILLLSGACSIGIGQSIIPILNPPSPVPTTVPPTVAPAPTSSPEPSITPIPPPTRRATIEFPTITAIPLFTSIPTTAAVATLASPTSSGPPGPLQCHLVSTSPEPGEILKSKQDFMGIWRVVNNGTLAWQVDDIAFFFVSGQEFQSSKYQEDFIPYIVNVGDQLNLHVPMKTPKEPGSYSATWGLRSKSKQAYFCFVSLFIIVEQ